MDRSFGLNLYVTLAHDDFVDLDVIEASGLHLLVQADEWSGDPRADHPAVDGWMVFDEADLTFGPGWDGNGPVTGGIRANRYRIKVASAATPSCSTSTIGCPLARCATPTTESASFTSSPTRRPRCSSTRASRTSFRLMTACLHQPAHGRAADRQGASYGSTVNRIRTLDGLDGVRQPVWGFVEVGHPFTEAAAPTISAPQMRSAGMAFDHRRCTRDRLLQP